MIGRRQDDDTFCRLSTNGNFPFLEKRGIHFFPKMSTAPLVVSFETMVFIVVRLFSRLFINFADYVNVYYFHVFTFSIV